MSASDNARLYNLVAETLPLDERQNFKTLVLNRAALSLAGQNSHLWISSLFAAKSDIERRLAQAAPDLVASRHENADGDVLTAQQVDHVPGLPNTESRERASGSSGAQAGDDAFNVGVAGAEHVVLPSVVDGNSQETSPSVGGARSAVCDNPNPTEGEPQSCAVVAPPTAAAQDPHTS